MLHILQILSGGIRWYADGKKKAVTGKSYLHITSPYIFAATNIVGQSITSPLIDPQSQRHIGQTLVGKSDTYLVNCNTACSGSPFSFHNF